MRTKLGEDKARRPATSENGTESQESYAAGTIPAGNIQERSTANLLPWPSRLHNFGVSMLCNHDGVYTREQQP